jgi:hypothetical protein
MDFLNSSVICLPPLQPDTSVRMKPENNTNMEKRRKSVKISEDENSKLVLNLLSHCFNSEIFTMHTMNS